MRAEVMDVILFIIIIPPIPIFVIRPCTVIRRGQDGTRGRWYLFIYFYFIYLYFNCFWVAVLKKSVSNDYCAVSPKNTKYKLKSRSDTSIE